MEKNKKTQVDKQNTDEKKLNISSMAPTKDYFTSDVESSIRDMSEVEMFRELLNFEGTKAWVALLKYNQIRLSQSQAAIFSGDPIKDPSNMLRNQGIMLGLCDLQNAVIMLRQEKLEEAEGAEIEGETK